MAYVFATARMHKRSPSTGEKIDPTQVIKWYIYTPGSSNIACWKMDPTWKCMDQ